MTDAEDWLAKHAATIDIAATLLPAWFVPRMMDDEWYFALLLVTGHVLHITHIEDVVQAADGAVWIDARMNDTVPEFQSWKNMKDLAAPTSRLRVSINAAHVVAAVETADT